MTELYLLRHADAGDPARWGGLDADRPLSAKGREQAERLAAHLAVIGLRPDALISSPKVRAVETAEPVADALGIGIRLDERLGAGWDLDDLPEILDDAGGPARPVLVGHDPDFSDVLSALVGAPIGLKKGALARVDFDDPPSHGGGALRWLLPPAVVPRG